MVGSDGGHRRGGWPTASAAAVLGLVMLGSSCGARTGTGRPTGGDGAPAVRDAAAPDVLDDRCPGAVPQIGDACWPDQLRCHYERCLANGKSDVTFLCNVGSWFFEDRWPCRPNPTDCPGVAPQDGAPCGLDDGSVCRWGPGSKGVCDDGAWRIWSG